ncbi:hypothetical protein CPB86DRAFT_873403 [Serendipita vermifera]|nr:hypothetical protein CPB86DRAFT_873403 [Serendipita vermifera]
MSKQHESAVRRTPIEIWWKILDEVIYGHNPLFFSTTFPGYDWSEYSPWYMSGYEYVRHERSEIERKVVGSVRRSWQAFSRSRRNRYVHITLPPLQREQIAKIEKQKKSRYVAFHTGICFKISSIFSSHFWPKNGHYITSESNAKDHITPKADAKDEWLQIIDKARQARRVQVAAGLWKRFNEVVTGSGQELGWEIVEIGQPEIMKFSQASLPRLRRLGLRTYCSPSPLNHNPFLEVLSRFTSLTWLEYEAYASCGQPEAIHKDRSPLILPNLQVLWYKNRGTFEFPFSHLILPSIQYLSLCIFRYPSLVPLLDILSCYRRTLRSFTAKGWDVIGSESVIHFPPWSDFPRLEELVLDPQWVAYFQSLPLHHPLRRLDANYGSTDMIGSLLEGKNIRHVILRKAYWRYDGGVMRRHGELLIDERTVNYLLKRAEYRGISFKVVNYGSVDLSREEAIAAAPPPK